jgi:hypothetical protein
MAIDNVSHVSSEVCVSGEQVLRLPEDWLFYAGDMILLQIVTHEQEATLRVSEVQYAEFKKLGIPHAPGCPRWSSLPEQPTRLPRQR